MFDRLLQDMSALGDIAELNQLLESGHSRRSIGRAISNGALVRLCRGWVATQDARQDAILAIANSGRLTSGSALRTLGIWDGAISGIHIQTAPHAPRTTRQLTTPVARFVRPSHMGEGVVRHWRPEFAREPHSAPWRVSALDALAVASRHLPEDQFVACVDSALSTRVLSRAALPVLNSLVASRTRNALLEVDARSESGLESLARFRLRKLGLRVEPQVEVPGLAASGARGRLDLLVNGWLNIEVDGDEWHDPRLDRIRDGKLVRTGYRTHRFGYDQVLFDWPATVATIWELLRYPPPPPLPR